MFLSTEHLKVIILNSDYFWVFLLSFYTTKRCEGKENLRLFYVCNTIDVITCAFGCNCFVYFTQTF